MFRGEHCFDLVKGQRVVIITRKGALGWEWIEDFAVRP
jgi:hypothetical protein